MNTDDALPVGTRVGEFEILRVIGRGGFGIVYEALDPDLEIRVALKEYYPDSWVHRSGSDVLPSSNSSAELFVAGKERFMREARLLARLNAQSGASTSLVIVHRVLQANQTAYMAMKLYSGVTLRVTRELHPELVTQRWLTSVLLRVLNALEVLHNVPGEQLVHRDVAPDNILLLDDGSPVLLDFGATRDASKESTALIYKQGYSPIEQYTEDLPQGPWTDLYALCAVAYFAMFGAAPWASIARHAGKIIASATERGAGRFTPEFLAVIDHGLKVLPHERFQDVNSLRSALIGAAANDDPSDLRTEAFPQSRQVDEGITRVLPATPVTDAWATTVREGTQHVDTPAAIVKTEQRHSTAIPKLDSVQSSRRKHLIFAVIGVVLVALLLGYLATRSSPTVPIANPESADLPVPPRPEPALPPPNISGLDCTVATIDWDCVVAGLLRHGSTKSKLDFHIDPVLTKVGDNVTMTVSSDTSGYLHVYYLDDRSDARPTLIFPNNKDRRYRLEVNRKIQLPGDAEWRLEIAPPLGRVWIIAVVTREAMKLPAVAPKLPQLPDAVRAFSEGDFMATLGWPKCAPAATGCPELISIQAAQLTIL